MQKPDNEELYLAAVGALEQGLMGPAREAAARLIKQEPNTERAAVVMAAVLEKDGQLEEAVELLQKFVGKNFQSAHARSNLGRLLWKAGDSEKCLQNLRLSLAQQPNQERTLHLFASIVEAQSRFESCFNQLLGLGKNDHAWVPLLVAAELAATLGEERQVRLALGELGRKGVIGRQLEVPRLLKLLESLRSGLQVEIWQQLRVYVPAPYQSEIDDSLLLPARSQRAPARDAWSYGMLTGGVLGRLLSPNTPPTWGLSTVRMVNASSWIPEEMAGRYGRGLALQLCEWLLCKHGVAAEVSLPYLRNEGLVDEADLSSGEQLKARASTPTLQNLISLFLTPQKDGTFIIDAEIYSHEGHYLSRLAARGASPSECLVELVSKLAPPTPIASPPELPTGWNMALGPHHALAREVVAAFILCARGELDPACIANPGFSLDMLAELAADSASAADLAALGVAFKAAEKMGVATAGEQLSVLRQTVNRDPVWESLLCDESLQRAISP